MKKTQSGWTLIELAVIVIVVAILAVVAFPRFISFSSESNATVEKSIVGSFHDGIQIIQYRSKLAPEKSTNTLGDSIANARKDNGTLIIFNASGWPEGTSAATANNSYTNTECAQLWNEMLAGTPPVIASGACSASSCDYGAFGVGGTCEYRRKNNTTFMIYDGSDGGVRYLAP